MGSLQPPKHAIHTFPRRYELCRVPLQGLPHGSEFHIYILLLRKELAKRQGKDSGEVGTPKELKRNQ